GILGAGDDTYTYIAVWNKDTTSSNGVILEQNSSSVVTGARGSLLTIGNTYGYNGENNDAHNIQAFSTNTSYVSILQLQADGTVLLDHNGTQVVGSVNISTANLGNSIFTVGYKGSTGTELFDGSISEVMVFSGTLTNDEIRVIDNYLSMK